MPGNISIAAFVLGAVLLLISILGGRFKIFGAEVSGVVGRKTRIVSGIAAALLLVVGLFLSMGPSTTSGKEAAGATATALPNNDGVTFTVSYDLGSNSLDGVTAVYIDGKQQALLYVDKNGPYATAGITVPKPGTYAYRLEQEESVVLYNADGSVSHVGKDRISDQGKIDVKTGEAYTVSKIYVMDEYRPHWKLKLEKVLSEAEQQAKDQEELSALEDMEKQLQEEQSGK